MAFDRRDRLVRTVYTAEVDASARQALDDLEVSWGNVDDAIKAVSLDIPKVGDATDKLAAKTKKADTDWLDRLAKIGLSMETVKKGIEIARNALDSYAESSAGAAEEVAEFQKIAGGAMDKLNEGIARAVIGFGPLIDAAMTFAGVLERMGRIPGADYIDQFRAQEARDAASQKTWDAMGGTTGAVQNMAARGGYIQGQANLKNSSDAALAAIDYFATNLRNTVLRYDDNVTAAVPHWSKGSSGKKKDAPGYANVASALGISGLQLEQAPSKSRSSSLGAAADIARDEYGRDALAQWNSDQQAFQSQTSAWLDELDGYRRQKTVIEELFGPIDQLNGYTLVFEGLRSVAVDVYSQLVDGTMSAGEAFRKAGASAIKSLGIQFLVEAAGQYAAGFKYLASYNVPSALSSFKAAAAYTAGAAIAGVAANQLGGGGGGGGGYSGATPSAPQTYSSGGGGGPSGPTIIYGDSFAQDSPRNRQRTAKRIVKEALGTSGVRYS